MNDDGKLILARAAFRTDSLKVQSKLIKEIVASHPKNIRAIIERHVTEDYCSLISAVISPLVLGGLMGKGEVEELIQKLAVKTMHDVLDCVGSLEVDNVTKH